MAISDMRIPTIVFAVLYIFGGVLVPNAMAQNNGGLEFGFDIAEIIADESSLSTQEPKDFITNAIKLVLQLVGLVALAVLIYGGFLFITSTGDEQKAERAKRLMFYAIAGLLLIGASVIIVNLVISLFST